jgi:hypothetical protein
MFVVEQSQKEVFQVINVAGAMNVLPNCSYGKFSLITSIIEIFLSLNIAESIQRRATGWTAGVRLPATKITLFFLHKVHTNSGAHPASYTMGIGVSLSPRVKRPGCEAEYSPPLHAEVKNVGDIPPPPIRLHGLVFD